MRIKPETVKTFIIPDKEFQEYYSMYLCDNLKVQPDDVTVEMVLDYMLLKLVEKENYERCTVVKLFIDNPDKVIVKNFDLRLVLTDK
jgi:hypothetical protein